MDRERELEKVKAYVDNDGMIHIENALICSKNFSGLEKRDPNNPKRIVNTAGNRNFSVELNQEAADLISNYRLVDHPDKAFKVQVKLPAKDAEDQTPRIFMSIKVRYDYYIDENTGEKKPYRRNPKIRQYSSNGKTDKDESTVSTIDEVYIEKAELVFSPSPYDVEVQKGIHNKGLSAYLRLLTYKIKENDIYAKWDQDYVTDDPTDYEEAPFA